MIKYIMLIDKIISISINVEDWISIYSDPDKLMEILINRYQGRCYAGCYINKIKSIVRMGECYINQYGSPDYGILSVTLDIQGIIFNRGEIITGCIVKNRDQTGIICHTDIADIIVAHHPLMVSITKGQIISVSVVYITYTINSPKVSINAVPYLPEPAESVVFKLNRSVSISETDYLADILANIKDIETRIGQIKTDNLKLWNTFDQLLYAYKSTQNVPMMDMNKLINSDDETYVSRDSRINLSTPNVRVYANIDEIPAGMPINADIPKHGVLLALLSHYYDQLKLREEMINIYNTDEKIKNHTNLWQIYVKSKK